MKIGLKEIGAVVALATAGCTSPVPEDAKDEAHPVYAASDVSRDIITEETIAGIRNGCADVRLSVITELLSGRREDCMGGLERIATDEKADKAENECLALFGLSEDGQ